MSKVDQAAASLKSNLQTLRTDWQRTRSSWQDAQAQRFEREDYAPLVAQAAITLDKMKELGAVVAQVRRKVR
jgi:hypothetical protein